MFKILESAVKNLHTGRLDGSSAQHSTRPFVCFSLCSNTGAGFEQFKQNTLKHLEGKKKKEFVQIDKCLSKSVEKLLPAGNPADMWPLTCF